MTFLSRSKWLWNHFQTWIDSNCDYFWMMTGWVVVSWSSVELCGRAGTGATVGSLHTQLSVTKGFYSWTIQCRQAREHRAITGPLSGDFPCLWLVLKYTDSPKEKVRPVCLQSSPYTLCFLATVGKQAQTWGFDCMTENHDKAGFPIQKDSEGHRRLLIISAAQKIQQLWPLCKTGCVLQK